MTSFNISEASKLTKKSRTTLHRYISTGKLSIFKDEQGNKKIDLTELLRVFPDIGLTPPEQPKRDTIEQGVTDEVNTLKREIEHLKSLLESKNEHISTLKQAMNILEDKTQKKGNWFFWKNK